MGFLCQLEGCPGNNMEDDLAQEISYRLSKSIVLRIGPNKTLKSISKVSGVLNDQIFKKALFRFRTTNWYLLSVLWLIINFPGKKIAAPQSQQDKVQRIPFASKQIH